MTGLAERAWQGGNNAAKGCCYITKGRQLRQKIGLVDILKLAGFNPAIPTRLVRHQDHRYPVQELLRQDGWLELYQSYQSKPRFHGAKQIVSFYAMARRRAAFFGVYKVVGLPLKQ